jgi:hypothetical protein
MKDQPLSSRDRGEGTDAGGSERTCEQCGRCIKEKRRQARYCGGPCRAASSRAIAARRPQTAPPVIDLPAVRQTAQKRTGDVRDRPEWRLATPAEEAEAERLRRRFPELTGLTQASGKSR